MLKFEKFSPQLLNILTKKFIKNKGVQTLPDYEVEVETIKQSETDLTNQTTFRRGFVLKSIVPDSLGVESNKNLKLIHKKTGTQLGITNRLRTGFKYVSDGEVYVDTELNSGICLVADKVDATTYFNIGDIITVKNQENFGSPLSHKSLNLIKDDLDFLNNTKLNISDKASSSEITTGTENSKYIVSEQLEKSKYGLNLPTDNEKANIGNLPTDTNQEITDLKNQKVNISDVIDRLTSKDTKKPLSANQGKILKDLLNTSSLKAINSLKNLLNVPKKDVNFYGRDWLVFGLGLKSVTGNTLETYEGWIGENGKWYYVEPLTINVSNAGKTGIIGVKLENSNIANTGKKISTDKSDCEIFEYESNNVAVYPTLPTDVAQWLVFQKKTKPDGTLDLTKINENVEGWLSNYNTDKKDLSIAPTNNIHQESTTILTSNNFVKDFNILRKSDIEDSLNSTSKEKVLSAKQGKSLKEQLNTLSSSGGFTQGMIMMFNGTTAPSGWAICDGGYYNQNGVKTVPLKDSKGNDILTGLVNVPDLRDRFIVGAGGGYGLGSRGGADRVTLTIREIPSHSHSGSTSQQSSHSHGFAVYEAHSRAGWARAGSGGGSYNSAAPTSYEGAHTHTFNTNYTGSGASHENRPPYYALMYIMKL